jgi:protein-S-isoprenylcysteine O-methyltransferase Ste14
VAKSRVSAAAIVAAGTVSVSHVLPRAEPGALVAARRRRRGWSLAGRARGILAVVRLLRHLAAILLLPGVVTVLVPVLLVEDPELGAVWPLGVLLLAAGIGMMAWTIGLFATVGRGTLAPWDPTQRLVVRGPYRRVRNPMISGVLGVLLGEAALLGSWELLGWAGVFFAVNNAYFRLVEEPGLRKRFGAEYEDYCRRVRRWVPR